MIMNGIELQVELNEWQLSQERFFPRQAFVHQEHIQARTDLIMLFHHAHPGK